MRLYFKLYLAFWCRSQALAVLRQKTAAEAYSYFLLIYDTFSPHYAAYD